MLKLLAPVCFTVSFLILSLTSCVGVDSDPTQTAEVFVDQCQYSHFKDKGNLVIDTLRLNGVLFDPVDDTSFEETSYGFYRKNERLYRKSKAHRRCADDLIAVEYFKDYTERIDLESFIDHGEPYFSTKGNVYFWWINSEGNLMVPIEHADPSSFTPFADICGGIDLKNVFYGCPNLGVNRLDIEPSSDFRFIPKEDNYWNSPKHLLVVNHDSFDIKYDLKRGYHLSPI